MTQETFSNDGAKITAYLDAPAWENAPTAALGGFCMKSEDAGNAVLSEALRFIREHGIARVIGPMDGDTWHSYRFVVETDGSPGFLLEPADAPDQLALFKKVGFIQISGYFSARVPVAAATRQEPEARSDFTVEPWDGDNPEALFDQVYDLSCSAFSKNAFYKPISREDFLAMYMPMVPVLKPDLISFARSADGNLVGFLFGTPNYAEGPAPGSVILKTYASLMRGAGQHLAYAFHTSALRAGYETAIHALIHDDNLSAIRSAAEGAEVFRRYGLFGLRLDG